MSRSCHLKRGQNEKGTGGKETSREAAEDTLVNLNRHDPCSTPFITVFIVIGLSQPGRLQFR